MREFCEIGYHKILDPIIEGAVTWGKYRVTAEPTVSPVKNQLVSEVRLWREEGKGNIEASDQLKKFLSRLHWMTES